MFNEQWKLDLSNKVTVCKKALLLKKEFLFRFICNRGYELGRLISELHETVSTEFGFCRRGWCWAVIAAVSFGLLHLGWSQLWAQNSFALQNHNTHSSIYPLHITGGQLLPQQNSTNLFLSIPLPFFPLLFLHILPSLFYHLNLSSSSPFLLIVIAIRIYLIATFIVRLSKASDHHCHCGYKSISSTRLLLLLIL